MEDYDIPHCQGMRKGVRIKDEKAIGIIVMLRAGLYLAEGLRELLRTSPMFLVEPKRGSGISEADLAKISLAKLRHALIVDAVVNTGASITPIFGQLKGIGIRGITVVAGVAPKEKAECLAADNLDINFLFARLSTNTYVGKGGTDTGNRLFGTEFLD
jgi:uracil phosphoribosyltransferase